MIRIRLGTAAATITIAATTLVSGCAPALSTMHPATVAPHRNVDAGAAFGVSVPIAGVSSTVGTARDNVERTRDGEPLSDADRDDIIRTSLGLTLNPPSFGSQYRVAYGIVDGAEVELRYALSAFRLGARWQMMKPESRERPLAGSVGIGVSRYVFSLGVPGYLAPIVDVDDFTRYDVDVPVLFGVSHDIYHVWGGPKLVASFMSAGIDVCTQFDTAERECGERASATLDGNAFYFAGQLGGAVGYKHVWIGAELTMAYVTGDAAGTLRTADVNEKKTYSFDDVILYPVVGLIIRI